MGKLNLRKGRCKNDENTMRKFILRGGDVKTMKILWENSI